MKKVLALVMIVLMLIPAVSAGAIDGSARFLKDAAKSTQQTREISLAIMALSVGASDLNWDITPDLVTLVNSMLSYQNPDGGWGLYPGETSNVLDTAYAVIALKRAYPHLKTMERLEIKSALNRGLSYLLSAENKAGWGYVPGTPSSCYPTLLAIWALGENGYSYNSRVVRNAVEYVENATCEIPEYEALALRLIAYHSIGYQVSNETLETVKELLLNEDSLKMKERAMLTYALVLYTPVDFDTARILIKLESYGKSTNDLVYWMNTPDLFSSTELIATTSYALMALSTTFELPPAKEVKNPYEMPCQELKNMQNPDGGWGLGLNKPSDEKATYYALTAIQACYPEKESIEKALAWTREAFKNDAAWMEKNRRMSVGYYYALKTLIMYSNITAEEKAQAEELIRSVQLDYGLWGNTVLGPQPYETSLAIKALRELGVPANDAIIQKAKDWLLSISNGGWGTYVTTEYYSYMLKPDVLTTITVLEALEGIATPEELKPHIEWLIDQRLDGGWPYWKTYYVWEKNREFPGTPTVELTVRATDLLIGYGYNYTNETLDFVMNARDSSAIDKKTIEVASAINYLSRFQYVPPVSLYDIKDALDSDVFGIIAPGMDNESIGEIINTLNDLFSGGFIQLNTTSIGEDSYIVMANFGDYQLRPYNPYLKFYVEEGTVTVGNITVPTNKAVVLIPGKTPKGVVLFVLYEPENAEIAKEIFTTGFIRYIRGDAMVLLIENGRVRVIVVG
ncbi:prenyltransferase/squalene oxidase repeat-containing protein [Thermococcus thermotolerans]|uniref:prenyltransferase/squalene oxidase repeat-containing protein n=1 Tax=Thermococcus thermotolerans TaxID=2969672 RepID=UPI002157086E|nr:prenyltransferase/squalene oxidase repeat-containing protein [Thermococcus thermotolerans]